ncbi:acyl-CoA dehydrogenase family protein [Actinocrinis puniceicyclus]|uniref:Acyl-CoA dehydrogenase family protein n=1 Tax=Actinocrinis puniceicyclus TaxID=977794 RepID=A0A8J7WKC5_9ACTN|nr:acyl-CoA dehydrogenase family protein [Actinocrinis puniceicyclus]MBS2962913.1 acyl-CoA dehydrogenase family protein [Actinocrinis puniceicyclus]
MTVNDARIAPNQAPPLQDYDVFSIDDALVEAVVRHAGRAPLDGLSALGRLAGSHRTLEWAQQANVYTPVLRTHDRYGNRIDEVEFHPAWHHLMEVAVSHGLAGAAWSGGPAAHTTRAAGFMVWSTAESGHGCPVSMTYASVAALRADPQVAAAWEPGLKSLIYDYGLRAPAGKAGLLCGMAMTEKQGGSDVRANTTAAAPLDAEGEYLLTGHKWFCSAPMSDLFLVLAQAPGGLTCFLVPRVLADGARNRILLQRLKDKLGNRSNASAEIEFAGAWARRLGAEGRGVPTIIEMVSLTRLDCVLGSAAIMRRAVTEATHHAAHRHAFGSALLDKPLMRNVLCDLAVESQAATALGIRLAAAFDSDDPAERALRRLGVAVGKYWVTKRAIGVAAEALECLGGNGYVEESVMPRLLREAPVNSIWEGSGNVNALDVLRALTREPHSAEAFLGEVGAASGGDSRFDAALSALRADLAAPEEAEFHARRLVERLATVFQAALLIRHAPHAVADAYCATRLAGEGGHTFGTLPGGTDTKTILDRAQPRLG